MDGTDCASSYVYPAINSGDNAWMLASGALVMLMTPGLGFFYGGAWWFFSSSTCRLVNWHVVLGLINFRSCWIWQCAQYSYDELCVWLLLDRAVAYCWIHLCFWCVAFFWLPPSLLPCLINFLLFLSFFHSHFLLNFFHSLFLQVLAMAHLAALKRLGSLESPPTPTSPWLPPSQS